MRRGQPPDTPCKIGRAELNTRYCNRRRPTSARFRTVQLFVLNVFGINSFHNPTAYKCIQKNATSEDDRRCTFQELYKKQLKYLEVNKRIGEVKDISHTAE